MLLVRYLSSISLLLLLMLQPLLAGSLEPSTEQAIKEISDKVKGVHTIKADMTLDVQEKNSKQHLQGDIAFREPMSMRINLGTMLMVLNGKSKTMWTYMPEQKTAIKFDMEKLMSITGLSWEKLQGQLQGQSLQNPKDPFSNLKKESLRFLRKELLNGELTYVFQGTVEASKSKIPNQQGNKFQLGETTIWLAAKDGLLRKLTAKQNGHPSDDMTLLFNNVQVNPVVNEQDFQFTPPEGSQIMDMTSIFEQMMQKGNKKQQ